MNTTMTPAQRQLRTNIRNAYLVATKAEIEAQITIRTLRGASAFEIGCFIELLTEV